MNNSCQEVKTIIKDNGFLVIQSKITQFSQQEAEKFYEEHKGQIKINISFCLNYGNLLNSSVLQLQNCNKLLGCILLGPCHNRNA